MDEDDALHELATSYAVGEAPPPEWVVMQPPQSANEPGWWLLQMRDEVACYIKRGLIHDHAVALSVAAALNGFRTAHMKGAD